MGYYQHTLPHKVRDDIDRFELLPRGKPVVVGVSGGPDSLCLLHVLRALAPRYEATLHAAHLNHQLRGEEADADARFVQTLAAEWGIACTIANRDVAAYARQHKLAIEEAARQCRYGFLAQVAARVGADTIAVGHNADDQTESVLMHLIRGSGLAGLRGMLPRTPLSSYRFQLPDDEQRPLASELWLIRPLLKIPRAEIQAYCQQYDLTPRFDYSNLDTTYFRNWLRHELLPLMEMHNPGVSVVLRRTASVIAADYELLRGLMLEAWPRVVRSASNKAVTFDLTNWRELPLALKRATLREAIHRLRQTLRNINFVHVENALDIATRGQTGEQATLPAGLMLTVSYDTFTVADADALALPPDWPLLEPGTVLSVSAPGSTPLPDSDWVLCISNRSISDRLPGEQIQVENAWLAWLDAEAIKEPLVLRTRQAGDRLAPLGMGGHTKALRDVYIHAKIPQAWRDRMPVLVAGSRIVWACGVQIAHEARVTPATREVLEARFVRMKVESRK